MPDFLDCSNTKLDEAQRQMAWLRTGWSGRGEQQTNRARSSKKVFRLSAAHIQTLSSWRRPNKGTLHDERLMTEVLS
jgi:hypothetical protein